MTATPRFAPADLPSVGADVDDRTTADDLYDALCDAGNLTRRQLLIWASNRLAPGIPVFTETALAYVQGDLDHAALARAYRAVVDESDALRAVIDEVDGWPRQRFPRSVDAELPFVDLTAAAAPADALEALVREREAVTVGGEGPLIDSVLVRLGPGRHVWVLVQHQLVSDAWSFALVHRRLVEHYRHECGVEADPAIARPQFRDYVTHERRYRASSPGRAARAYWEQRRRASVVRPPARAATVGRDATRVRRAAQGLGSARTTALRRLAIAVSPSIDTGLFCIFGGLALVHMAETHGLREVELSVPFANRPTQRFKSTVGSFMNICPVRVGVEHGDTFLTLLERVVREMWEVARHQAYAVRHVAVAQPHDVLVNIHKEAVAGRDFAGLPMAVEWLAPSHRFGALAIGVQDFNAAGELTLVVDCNVATFGAERGAATSADLLRLLDDVLADPTRRLDDGRSGSAMPTSGRPTAAGPSAPPRTDLEHAIARIWCRMLRVSTVGRDDDFFELGGDSLLVYRMLVRLRVELGVAMAPEAFFEHPTVAAVAAASARYPADAVGDDALEHALREIEGLTNAQAETLLAREAEGWGPDDA